MKLALIHLPAAVCPYRLLDDVGHEIAWANDFLDAQYLRQLSPRSLRAYAYDLLHFVRWFQSQPQTLSEITESTLLDYVRHQLSQQPQPTPQTVNHRLTVIRCVYRFHCGQEIPSGNSHLQLQMVDALPSRLPTGADDFVHRFNERPHKTPHGLSLVGVLVVTECQVEAALLHMRL